MCLDIDLRRHLFGRTCAWGYCTSWGDLSTGVAVVLAICNVALLTSYVLHIYYPLPPLPFTGSDPAPVTKQRALSWSLYSADPRSSLRRVYVGLVSAAAAAAAAGGEEEVERLYVHAGGLGETRDVREARQCISYATTTTTTPMAATVTSGSGRLCEDATKAGLEYALQRESPHKLYEEKCR